MGGWIAHRGGAATVAAVVVLALTACGGNAVRGAYRTLEGPLASAADDSRVVVDDLLETAAREGGVEPPPGLLSGLEKLPPGSATKAESAIADEARLYADFYAQIDAMMISVDALEARLPSESYELILLTLRQDASPSFVDDVEDVTARLLRSATCQAARDTLDATSAQAAAGVPDYEYIDIDEPGASARWISAQLSSRWNADEIEVVLDTVSLASKTLTRSIELVDEAGTVIESPDGTILRANLLYFRMCVLR